jgi:glycosyltransferase involved in cell wall biosynthesis
MTDALRILMVVPTPWDWRLGAPSVQMHLASHLRASGNEVSHFCLDDAFPRLPRSRLGQLLAPPFGKRAVPAVRAMAASFDVIDAQQGTLPATKADLAFRGALVARSPGLAHAYRRFLDTIPQRWADAPAPNPWARPVRRRQADRQLRDVQASFRASDLILVPNADEADELAGMGFRDVTRVVPNGIPDELVNQPGNHRALDVRRAAERGVSVIATWDLRKGRLDWPAIIARVRDRVPSATFTFLGTRVDERQVLEDLGNPLGIDVVPTYGPVDLPGLLSEAKVGALASYAEGFGLGLVEQMACGLPAVAYDVAGPRHTIGSLDRSLLAPPGDVGGFADALCRVLLMPEPEYIALADRVRSAAVRYRYSTITEETLQAYRDVLTRLRT